ncbi:MAG: O-antigen ligase family protein [Pyrinomonadaceae bacterium]
MADNRSIYITLVACLLGLVLVQAAIRSSGVGPVSYGVLVVGGALLIAAWRSWEFGIQALMVIVVVEGAVRKWLLPSASEVVYFYKDILMVVILLAYLTRVKKPHLLIKGQLGLLSAAFAAFIAYSVAALITILVAAATSQGGPHPLIGLLGIKVYCLYIPLTFLVPRMFPNKEKLIRFLKWYSLIVLPVAILCAMQFSDLDQSSTLNKYAGDVQGQTADIATFSDSAGNYYIRVTGTFSYISGLTAYLPTMFALLLGLISLRREVLSASIKWLFYLAVGTTVIATFMSGSRAPVVILIAITLLFYCLTSMRNLFRRLIQIAVLSGIIFAGLTSLFPQAFDALYERALGDQERTGESLGRVSEPFTPPLDEAVYAGLTGFGIGVTQNAVPALMKKLDAQPASGQVPIAPEGEAGRVMLELGVIGYLLYILLRVALIITVCKVCLSVRDPQSRIIAIGILCALAAPLLLGGAIVSHTQNVLQWFLVGASLAVMNAEALEIQPMRTLMLPAPQAHTGTCVP